MVRFTSTERAKQGEEEDTAKFARGNRLSMAEQIRCYREECQRIFDLQNRVLSNPELLSTDEEDEEKSSEDEDEDGKHSKATIGGIRISNLPSAQQSAKNVQSLLANKITSAQLQQKQEELEKEELKRSIELGASVILIGMNASIEKSKLVSPESYISLEGSSVKSSTIQWVQWSVWRCNITLIEVLSAFLR